jgi:hypothetical protein
MENYLKRGYFQKNKIIFTCILLFARVFVCAQENNLNSILSSFNQYTQKNLYEKLYLHSDKSLYLAGEIIWFKLYVVEGTSHKPSSVSKVAYVEVINSDLKPVLQGKISLAGGVGNGSFLVPASLPSGNYKIRAYTNWMKNFSADYFFEEDISVINSFTKLGERLPPKSPAYDMQFFPEGGNLVNDLPARVGFKVVDQNGKGVDASGIIVDQDKKTVASFESLNFGMGNFSFVPLANNHYTAFIKVNGNNVTVADLPVVYREGYVLKVEEENNDEIIATIYSNSRSTHQFVYLLIHTREMLKLADVLSLNNGKAVVRIPKTKLGDGISCFTLFDAEKKPVCERLYFKQPAALSVIAQPDLDEYGTRKRIILDIRLNGSGSDTGTADLSLSVFKLDSLQHAPMRDIRSYIWMGSDISGNIESPEYYFTDSGETIRKATDNLMLTQGWRRFKWEDVLQNKAPGFEFIPEYAGQLITGEITDKKSGEPVENITVYAAVPGDKYELGTSISNKKGKILFDLRNFYGSNVLIVQTDPSRDSTYAIDISNPFSEKYADRPFPEFDLPGRYQSDILSHSIGTQVQGTFGIGNLYKFKPFVNADSTSFFGIPDKKFFLDDYIRFNSMEEVMREYIAGLTVKRRGRKYHFRVMNEPLRIFFEDDPLMLLDGVPVFDGDQIMAIDPLKIKKIEVVTRKYFQGSLVATGIISLTSYHNDLEGFQLDPHSLILEYEGLQLKREFYSPNYDKSSDAESRVPDFRNVLLWNPDIRLSEKGNTQVSFYTSDRKGKYIGIIQGITTDGKPVSGYFYTDVK